MVTDSYGKLRQKMTWKNALKTLRALTGAAKRVDEMDYAHARRAIW
jgi:hypothetical protein